MTNPTAMERELVVNTSPDALETRNQDAAAMHGSGAMGLLEPRDERALAMWLAAHPLDPILTQGAVTSLTGGATPDGDIVVSTRHWNRIAIADDRQTVRVQAGALLVTLQETLAEAGLYYAPAPTHDGASLGGNVSTNAAGAATFKYGRPGLWNFANDSPYGISGAASG
jgi:FAD/FMN-containing dehydrogenase